MTGHRSLITTLLALSALTLAACSAGTAEESTTTTAGVETTEATESTVTTADPDDTDAPSGICLEAMQAMGAAMASYGAGFSGATTGGLDEESLAEAAAQLEAMAGAAPDEIREDMEVIAAELEAFYTALADVGYEPGAVPTEEQMAELAEVFEGMDDEAFQEASDNVNAWFDANC